MNGADMSTALPASGTHYLEHGRSTRQKRSPSVPEVENPRESVSRSSIRAKRAGRHLEVQPRVRTWERGVLLALVSAGVYALMHFADFWFDPSHRRGFVLFAVLSFSVFWKPLRTLYEWWVFLWVEPIDVSAPTSHAPSTDATVDVLTTAMPGEPRDMIFRTLGAMAQMLCIKDRFLLDGSNDPVLREACDALGVIHVDCSGIRGAKAGKVNHCLRGWSRSDFVLIIDPDHVPRHDFVPRVLPWFSDPRVGFVQIVQAYYNHRRSWVAWAAAEQTFCFYGPTQMGLHGLGVPTAIGANCTFRRAAFDAIGGHAEHLAEDALTSMRIHACGYRSVYLPWRGTIGLVPEDLTAFWKQQLKWAAGMTDLLVRHYPRLCPRFDALGRLHYLLVSTYYVGALAMAFNLWLPVVLLLFDARAVEISLTEFLIHLAPFAAITLLVQFLVQRWYSHPEERGLPWRALLLERATWHVHLWGFVAGLLGLRIPYLPTPKNGSHRVPIRLLLPHLALIVASLAAISWVFVSRRPIEAGTELMMALAALNALLLLPGVVTGLRSNVPSQPAQP